MLQGAAKTEVTENSHDKQWWPISNCAGDLRFACRSAKDCAQRSREETGGLRQYSIRRRVPLSLEGQSGAGAGGFDDDEDYGDEAAGVREGSEAFRARVNRSRAGTCGS